MSKLTDLTVTALLESFASPAPTPGGGSAAALAGALGAYRLPKASEQDKQARTAAIQAALHGATEIPIDVMRACHAAGREGITVARSGNPSAASDTGVAFE